MQGPTRRNDPSQLRASSVGRPENQEKADPSPHPNGRKGNARWGPRVVRPHEDMRANFLGMTAVSLFVPGAKTRCAAPAVETTAGAPGKAGLPRKARAYKNRQRETHVKTTLGKTSKGLRSAAENAADLSYIETAKNDPCTRKTIAPKGLLNHHLQ